MSTTSLVRRRLARDILYKQYQRSFPQPDEMFYGQTYFVDATNGNAGYDGLSMEHAKKTIGQAITLSNADIALTANHCNKIFIMGGTYSEDVTGASQCDLIGLDPNRSGWSPRIAGKLVCDSIKGMRLFNLQIVTDGAEATVLTSGGIAPHNFEMHNCEIRMSASETYGFHMYGDAYYVKIKDCRFTGDHDYGIYIEGKCKGLEIKGNWITAKTCGIYFKQGITTDEESIIKDNVILRGTGATALTTGIDFAMTDRTPNVKVIHNWIAAGDAIHYGSTSDPTYVQKLSCIDNHTVSSAAGTGVIETAES